jgi:hypothetical protein
MNLNILTPGNTNTHRLTKRVLMLAFCGMDYGPRTVVKLNLDNGPICSDLIYSNLQKCFNKGSDESTQIVSLDKDWSQRSNSFIAFSEGEFCCCVISGTGRLNL